METLFIVDPLETLKEYKDSSIAMMRALQARGHAVWIGRMHDLHLWEGRVVVLAARINIQAGPDWFTETSSRTRLLADFSAVLMRKDPPVDQDYLAATHLLSVAEEHGARVFNRASSLRDYNEKLAIFRFPQFVAPTLVSSSRDLIDGFLEEHGDIIVKPLHAMGGEGVFRLRPEDPNRSAILETLTRHGEHAIMAQRFLPEISAGDKRIILIDGEPVPHALARIPAPGETRGNLAAGGTGHVQALTERDEEIARTVGRVVREAGIFLAGLDVIGEYLTEINVTSPTGFVEITTQSGFDVADAFVSALEATLG
ncbi:MAG: glutathione synthase [Hydrogenophilaceae bacterium]|nr:glutathione synthase [Hydrogenophilaceae bacterium]